MINNIPTLVLGASENPARYSHIAVKRLLNHGHEVFALGNKPGKINDVTIHTDFPENQNIHTITLYLNASNQKEYYNKIIELEPERVIFNPGTENTELREKLNNSGISSMNACTLVLLNTGQYV